MRILDCTLRDGANVVGCGFSAELTESMVRGLLACGIRDIELGNAKGLGAYEALNAKTPLTDLAYMELIAPYTEQGRLGMFQLAALAKEDHARMAADHGLNFLRVGADAGSGEQSVGAVKMVKKAGLTCRYSLMKAYLLTPEALAQEARLLEEAGVDVITIMDSAGMLFPDTAADYVRAMKARVSVPVGFHGHSNLGLSQANALAAAAAGADEVDGGLLGMARSAGNCATELAVAALQKMGHLKEVDFYRLLDYLDRELIPAMQACGYHAAVSPEDLMLGLTGTHSSFQKLFHKVAEEEQVSLYRLYAEVSEIDRKAPSEALIRETAVRMKGCR